MKIKAYACPSCGAPLDVNYDTTFTFCPHCGCKILISYEGKAAPKSPDLRQFTASDTRVPIWYDPKKPERVIIADAPTMRKTVESWKRTRKRSLIWMLIFFATAIIVFALSREEKLSEPSRSTTTIGQFSQEISALEDKTPTALVYTESISSPETFSVTVDDPAFAREALHIILSASVSKQGCQVDMAQYRYEEYCFFFGEETFTFGFLPHSYFCYNGQDYELGENRLSTLCDSLHEMAAEAETAQSKWYGDGALLQTRFVDNGDEARSVTELTLSAGGETLTGVIEGAYDVLSIEKQSDGYVIRYTYGDFYSHDTIRSSRITVESGKMIITDIAR